MLTALLTETLRAIVGTAHVRTRAGDRAVYRSDGLPTHRITPGLVVLPGTREETIAVVRALHEADIPFVARGAGTGLSGGALADAGTVLLVLTRLRQILSLDPIDRRAVIEPGVINAALSRAAAPFGLHFAPDPSSQVACTIGGNIAENAGGPHCLKYGVTGQHILALDVLLANGEVIRLGSPHGEPDGPDLVGLFVGSEGMFGVVLNATVRLTPDPPVVHTLLVGFPTLRTAAEAVSALLAAGVTPAALELMDRQCVAVVEASIHAAGYPHDAAAVLLCELDGSAALVAHDVAIATTLFERAGATSLRSASDAVERERLWQGRKRAFGALGRLGRDLSVQDAVVPRSAMATMLERIQEIAHRHDLLITNVFHAGDGNLHPCISFDARIGDSADRAAAASDEIMAACLELGGTITGEHGVGLDKRDWMPEVVPEATLAAMCEVRRAFDPSERANPGKVYPMHVCREWRHGGSR